MDRDLHAHYLEGGIPDEIAENYKNYVPDYEDISYEEFLLQQGSVYYSFQERGNQNSNLGQSQGAESQRRGNSDSQEALDAALARSLELGEDFNNLEVIERSSSTDEIRTSSTDAPSRSAREIPRQDDDIDPDNMTYDELVQLGDDIGIESKGVSKGVLAMLPTFKYKRGFFSKKKASNDCVICLIQYSNGDQLTTLPCLHQYHLKCITEWLNSNKTCPVCKVEVGGD